MFYEIFPVKPLLTEILMAFVQKKTKIQRINEDIKKIIC